MKVRTHLVLTVAAAMLPLAVFSAIGLHMLLNDERAAALRGAHETARATALAIDRELSNAEAAMTVLATSHALEAGNLAEFYRQAAASNRYEGMWTVLFDHDGYQVVNTRVPFGSPLPRRPHPENGAEIMRTQKPRVTDLVIGRVRKKFVVSMDMPVALEGGQRYTISQAFVPEYFNRIIMQQPVPSNWIIELIDRKGTIIARSRYAQQFVGKSTTPALVKAIYQEKNGMVSATSPEGADIFAVYAGSTVSGWTVSIGIPKADIENAAWRAIFVAATGLLIALACAAAAAFLFGKRLIRSIRTAEQSAVALGRDAEPVSRSSGVTEVDQLHDALSKTGSLLKMERDSRLAAESELAKVLISEREDWEERRVANVQNKSNDEFLAMLGHELRNPLAPLSTAAEIMKIMPFDAKRLQQSSQIVARQVRHMKELVDDLQDVSRLARGLVPLAKAPQELNSIISSAVEQMRPLIELQQHHLELMLVDVPVYVMGDSRRLVQMIGNLLHNAATYTPPGGNISLKMHMIDDQVELIVADDGIGIAEELQPHMFDLFTLGERKAGRLHAGLGLGLALVKSLAELHGGTIACVSEGHNKGRQFTVRLPTITQDSEDGGLQAQQQDVDSAPVANS